MVTCQPELKLPGLYQTIFQGQRSARHAAPTTSTPDQTMDFASILASEISKKRKEIPASSSSSAVTPEAPPKKYLKRGELEAQLKAQYLRQQRELTEERAKRAEELNREQEAAARRREEAREKQRQLAEERRRREEKPGASASPEKNDDGANGGEPEMTDDQALAKLRELGEPARLFGESATGRVKRCRRIVVARAAAREDDAPAALLEEEEMQLDPTNVKNDPDLVYRQLDAWFKLVMREWKKALGERPMSVKESYQGKKAADAMKQADEYMKPLFKHFRQKDLRPNVYEKVCEIVIEAQNRRYVKANDVYLKLSIGNAYVHILHNTHNMLLTFIVPGLSVLPWLVSTNGRLGRSFTKTRRMVPHTS
jgi:pre-mRNA-splicing factor 18